MKQVRQEAAVSLSLVSQSSAPPDCESKNTQRLNKSTEKYRGSVSALYHVSFSYQFTAADATWV